MLCTVLGRDTGDINDIVLLTFWSGEGTVGGSPPTVTTLVRLVVVLRQQLGVVSADQATHVGHALVGDLDSASVQEFYEGIIGRERCINYSEELFPHISFYS